jgi:hypothetical protein
MALQKYMHEFHADRDDAICNIQTCSIPVVQLTQLQKLSNQNFVLVFSKAHSNAKCFSTKWQHEWCLAE